MHLPQGYINVLEGHKPPQERLYDYVYQYKDHLGNVRLSFAYDKTQEELRTVTEHNYYPFGLEHSYLQTRRRPELVDEIVGEININSGSSGRSRMMQVDDVRYQYKYNGKEWQDELNLNLYDYWARNYDPALGRWMNIDPLAGKWSTFSPYNYTLNNPMYFIDPNGEDVYLFYYVRSDKEEDNSMFWNAAITRALDMLGSMGENDTFRITAVDDLGELEDKVNSNVNELSPKYGKTREFSIFSHSGLDGPIGSKPASKNALYNKGDLNREGRAEPQNSSQLSMKGWGNIDFNWVEDGNAKAYFWGCNSANDIRGGISFTTSLSNLSNFKDVSVAGQPSSSYPSRFTNVRETNAEMRAGNFDHQRTYMVAADPLGLTGRWSSTPAKPMIVSKNGKVTGKITPKGTQKLD